MNEHTQGLPQEGKPEVSFKRLPAKELLKRVGPSIVLTGIVIGPGAITTASMLGSKYGYALLWLLIPIAFMGTSFLLTTYRVSLQTGLPAIHAIRYYYGKFAAGFVGIASFLSCMFFTMGNISGTGAGMTLLFGINWKPGSVIMIAVMIYCYFAKNVYSKVEKAILLCILGLIVSFYATLIGAGNFSGGEAVKGLTQWYFPSGSLALALAFISTNASVTTGIYGTYLGKEKKWKKEDLTNGVITTDTIAHIVEVVLISGAMVLVGAIVLHPTHKVLNSPQQLADMLTPVLGNAARYVMGIALLGAAFSSLLGNTQRTVVLLNAGFNKPTNLEDKSIRWGSMTVLLICAVIAFSYNGSPVQLIYLSNVATAVATPVSGLFMCLLIWRKDINAGMKTPRVLQICMTISYGFCLILTISALATAVPKFISSLTGIL